MATSGVQPKLTVILHADVVESTALVQKDERLAHERIQDVFQRFSELITLYGGKTHELRGDALLAEFNRASDAVSAALAFQASNAEHNASLSGDIRPFVRVGISLGEIVIADGTLTGPEVVLAQRLEQLADPGGIYVSQAVFQAIPRRHPFDFKDLGDQEVKGFDDPVRAYSVGLADDAEVPPPDPQDPTAQQHSHRRILTASLVAIVLFIIGILAWWQPWKPEFQPATVERMAYPLPDKPSIAVLPFANLTGDPKKDILSDGITENIITALSRVHELFVIARTSILVYKGKAVKVQQVAENLGVRYILEGSVQQSGDKVRVTAQLIDALKGNHLWAERYDREVKDAFALQDEITLNILSALEVKLVQGDIARITRKGTDNLEAYQFYRRAFRHFYRFTEAENDTARRLFQKAADLDPEFANAWYMVGNTHNQSARFGWGEGRTKEQARALELTDKALAIDPNYPGPYNLKALISMRKRQYEKAIAYSEKAVSLSPNGPIFITLLGRNLVYAGRPMEGLPLIQQGNRRNPIINPLLMRFEGEAYHALGRYEEALAAFEQARARDPQGPPAIVWLAMTYADMGRMDEARTAAQEVLKLNPRFSAKRFVNAFPYKDRTQIEKRLTTLRQLGLPD